MRILVLLGGSSPERVVSLESGRCVATALREHGHEVGELDPSESAVENIDVTEWDIAFPMVHGTGGEDGTLQRQLQKLGLPWVGSSPEASELTFDKIRTADLLTSHGIHVPAHQVVRRESVSSVDAERLTYPLVIKPPRQGSSVGVSVVRSADHLPAAFECAFRYDEECMIQPFVAGREVTVPVVNGTAFPAIEIVTATEWYDYHAKYTDDRTQYAVAPEDMPSDLCEIAVSSCKACEVTGIARVDFIVDESNESWLLEINTIPGMTSHSLVPKSAASRGLSLGELCEATAVIELNNQEDD